MASFGDLTAQRTLLTKGTLMSNLHSALTILLLLAIMFAPQLLAIYFNQENGAGYDEYLPDGR